MKIKILACTLLLWGMICYAQDFFTEKEIEKKSFTIEMTSRDGTVRIVRVQYTGNIDISARFEGQKISIVNPIDTRKLVITAKPTIFRSLALADEEKLILNGNNEQTNWAVLAASDPKLFQCIDETTIRIPLISKESYNFSLFRNDNRENYIQTEILNFDKAVGEDFLKRVDADFSFLLKDLKQQYNAAAVYGIDKNGERYEL